MKGSPIERFTAKVAPRADGCWIWTAAVDKTTGYGKFHADGHTVNAHRFAYETFVGPVPAGLDLDHLCRVRSCVKPAHLEPVTRRENLMRGDTLAAAHAAGDDCGFAKCRSCGMLRAYRERHRTIEASA